MIVVTEPLYIYWIEISVWEVQLSGISSLGVIVLGVINIQYMILS